LFSEAKSISNEQDEQKMNQVLLVFAQWLFLFGDDHFLASCMRVKNKRRGLESAPMSVVHP